MFPRSTYNDLILHRNSKTLDSQIPYQIRCKYQPSRWSLVDGSVFSVSIAEMVTVLQKCLDCLRKMKKIAIKIIVDKIQFLKILSTCNFNKKFFGRYSFFVDLP